MMLASRDGHVRQKIQIRETKLKLTLKGDFSVISGSAFFVNFVMHSTKRYLNGQI